MKRKIQFNKRNQSINNVCMTIGGAFLGLFIVKLILSSELNHMSYIYPFLAGLGQFWGGKKVANKRLSIENDEFYLHGLIAALRYRRPTIWRSHVRVTSLTKTGYYRIRVYENEVSENDWKLLLSKCT
ncbi:hypothetical protein L4D20_12795 [Vibrio kyushuensis]|uniref:hypothetical protein n=1 Tax=Vibrio kyushuensis TaxID=2910249 RepID=UPI003D0C9478